MWLQPSALPTPAPAPFPVITLLPAAKAAGLDGMEVLYSKFDAETTALAGSLAEEFSLLPSGGSDFHGGNKPDISLGTGKGNLSVPADFATALQEVSRK